ncbi:MAG: CDP-alcohol phosphatidyltransferase family protein [Weeksellaceae bacterium]|nr:CDP-alcohol phosphatidyltransferase family protein [Weeksellaceae bacterium]
MQLKKNIPHALTLLNLLCGCILVLLASIDFGQLPTDNLRLDIVLMLVLLVIALVADLLDGMVARKLGVSSELGVQLDSLADMVSFGVFPGMLMAKMIAQMPFTDGIIGLSTFGFAITLASAVRLGKYNIAGNNYPYFLGLATPSNTLWVFGFYLWMEQIQFDDVYVKFWIAMIFIAVSSYLLVSRLPLFSLKDGRLSWKKHIHIFLLLAGSVVLYAIFNMMSLFYIIPLYIILSIIFRNKFVK